MLSSCCITGDAGEVWGYSNDGKICWSNDLCRAQQFCQIQAQAEANPDADYLQALSTCKAETLDCLADDACFAAYMNGSFDGPDDPNTGSGGYAGSTCASNALCDAYVRCTYPLRGWASVIAGPPPAPSDTSAAAAGGVRAFLAAAAAAMLLA